MAAHAKLALLPAKTAEAPAARRDAPLVALRVHLKDVDAGLAELMRAIDPALESRTFYKE
jgi:hypothetical protein